MDKNKNLVLIDFETYNASLTFLNNRPWQVAMLKVKNDSIVDSLDKMIAWDCGFTISEEAKRITNFNEKKYEKLKEDEAEVFETVYDWLDGCDYIVGHNVLGFDMYLMRGWCKHHNKPYNHFFKKCIDTLSFSRGVKTGIPFKEQENTLNEYQYKMLENRKRGIRASLGEMGKYYSVDFDANKLHDALADLDLNLKVWKKLRLDIERM